MSDEQQIWKRQPGESLTWFRRFERYRLMVPVRKIAVVFQEEQTEENRGKPRRVRTEPTGDWYEIAKQWHWDERVAAWDTFQTAQIEHVNAQERERILRFGFALMHKRIQELDRLANKLIAMTNDESKVWIPEIRTFQSGKDTSSTVEKVEFNAQLFTLIDKYFGSIAAELGERVKKKDVTITELPPNVYTGFDPDQDGVDE